MGASIAEGGLDDDEDYAEAHEINVTPFIDVILVLLIIFMVAAPLSTVDLPVNLPTSSATPQKKPDKPTYVSIKADLAVAIGETMVKRVDLVRTLDSTPNITKDSFIFLRADRAVPYGDLMDVLEILRAGGFTKIKLVALEGVPDAQSVPAGPSPVDTVRRRGRRVDAWPPGAVPEFLDQGDTRGAAHRLLAGRPRAFCRGIQSVQPSRRTALLRSARRLTDR